MDLAAFLAKYPVDTPLELHEWHSESRDAVRCVLRTSPWWVDEPERGQDNGQLVIRCTGVAESEIRLGWRASEVEDLDVFDEDPLLWPYGRQAKIFGNAPLPDPDQFFLEFTELVEYRGGTMSTPMPDERPFLGYPRNPISSRTAITYLRGISFSAWRRRVTERTSYLLLEGPAPLMVECTRLLDRQNAVYRLLLGRDRPQQALRLVCIGESLIICESATVEATPAPRV